MELTQGRASPGLQGNHTTSGDVPFRVACLPRFRRNRASQIQVNPLRERVYQSVRGGFRGRTQAARAYTEAMFCRRQPLTRTLCV